MMTIRAKNTSRTTPIIDETNIHQSSKQQMSSISQNEKPNLSPSGELNKTDTKREIESSQINISTETIYLLLTGELDLCTLFFVFLIFFFEKFNFANCCYFIFVGLIALTLVSLMVGIICRLDCCGIKTKCCRTNHNNRATSQEGQPHEEIPLNKV